MNYCCIFLGFAVFLMLVMIKYHINFKKRQEKKWRRIPRRGNFWSRALAQKVIDQKLEENSLKRKGT